MNKETARLEAFSDGVFAIAITLLIIEIHVPEVEGGGAALARELVALWPSYFAFLLSFVTILIMWMNHHAMFAWIEKGDGAIYVGNGLLLMTITALPFSTALLGDHLGHKGENVAAGVYAGHLLVISVAFGWLWLLLGRRRSSCAPALPEQEYRRTFLYCACSSLLYGTALALAWFSAAAAIAVTFLLAAFWTWNAYRRFSVDPRQAAYA